MTFTHLDPYDPLRVFGEQMSCCLLFESLMSMVQQQIEWRYSAALRATAMFIGVLYFGFVLVARG